jgi:hypothetical protein
MNDDSTISHKRLELIYESALRQLRSGRSLARVAVNLQAKGLKEDEAEKLANKVYCEYQEEEKRRELKDNYCKPLIPFSMRFFKTIISGLIAWVLSILTGHLVILHI